MGILSFLFKKESSKLIKTTDSAVLSTEYNLHESEKSKVMIPLTTKEVLGLALGRIQVTDNHPTYASDISNKVYHHIIDNVFIKSGKKDRYGLEIVILNSQLKNYPMGVRLESCKYAYKYDYLIMNFLKSISYAELDRIFRITKFIKEYERLHNLDLK